MLAARHHARGAGGGAGGGYPEFQMVNPFIGPAACSCAISGLGSLCQVCHASSRGAAFGRSADSQGPPALGRLLTPGAEALDTAQPRAPSREGGGAAQRCWCARREGESSVRQHEHHRSEEAEGGRHGSALEGKNWLYYSRKVIRWRSVMADSSGGQTEKLEKAEKKDGPSGKKETLQSERPKRDAAKKFIDDVGTGKLDGRKSLSEAAARAPGPARKAGAKGQDGAKRPAGTGAPRKPQAAHHSDVPKVSVDTGIRRLDLAALKRCATRLARHDCIAFL